MQFGADPDKNPNLALAEGGALLSAILVSKVSNQKVHFKYFTLSLIELFVLFEFLSLCLVSFQTNTHIQTNVSKVTSVSQMFRHSLAGLSLHFQTDFTVGAEKDGWTHVLGPVNTLKLLCLV